MRDYTQGLSAEAAASWVSIFESLMEFESPNITSYTRYYEVAEILSIAISVIDAFGYVKAKNEYDEINPDSTRNNVRDYIAGCEYFLKKSREYNMVDPKLNRERADEIIAWALDQKEDYGYMTNLMVLLRKKYCEYKHFGLVISAVASHRRALEKKEHEEKNSVVSAHIGVVGQRISFKIKNIICLTSYETIYGMTFLYKITDMQDNIYIWKTSKYLGEIANAVITGTIKNHGEYNGEKQTEITRCKIKAA
jgi:hypothetical protein